MKKQNNLKITVYSFCSVGNKEKAQQFVDIMLKHGLNPLRYDTSDRTKYLFEKDQFVNFWVDLEEKTGFGIPFVKGKDFYASISWGGAKPNNAGLKISIAVFKTTENAINFTKDLFQWYDSVYAYISDYEYYGKLYTPGHNIMDCLGGITWANFFGKPYVDMWGEEKLLKAPTWKTERLNDGGFLLITTESPLTDRVIADEAEAKLRAYLGEEHFFKRPTEPERITRAELCDRVFGDHKPEPTGYVAPNFSKYYEI